MSLSLKHNKKRSTAIVYEFLIRKASEGLIEGNRKKAGHAVTLIKRYFSIGTPIGNELEMINAMRKNRGISESLAAMILNEVKQAAVKLDRRLIEIKKSNLIKEINHTFGQDFFSAYRLSEYKALASMQVFLESFSSVKKNTMSENVNRAQIENAIKSFMTSTVSELTEAIDPDRNQVSYKLAVGKFQKKYGSTLSKSQVTLLEKYVAGLFSGDFKQFRDVASVDQKKIYRKIIESLSSKECKEDKLLKERLNESAVKLKELKISTDESFISEMMLFYDLMKEIDSNV